MRDAASLPVLTIRVNSHSGTALVSAQPTSCSASQGGLEEEDGQDRGGASAAGAAGAALTSLRSSPASSPSFAIWAITALR